MNMFFPEDNLSASENAVKNNMFTGIRPLDGTGILSGKEHIKSGHWSISWSDLMMTMFIFFVILYAHKISNKDIPIPETEKSVDFHEERTPGPSGEFSRFYEMSRQILRAKDLQDITRIELMEDRIVKIILPGDILFESGNAYLKSGAKKSLKAVAGIIEDTGYTVTIAGHTDSIPINTPEFPSNWDLSTARACEAARYLINESGISSDQIQIIGYAEYKPVASNETPEGRSSNRRVEIIISRENIQEK